MKQLIDYDFYRFSRLVTDLIIRDNDFCIPYDLEYEIILKAYSRFNYSSSLSNPYDEQVEFILSDRKLLLDLQSSNEGF